MDEKVLRDILIEMQEQNRIGRAILEQIEDARVEMAKHNCKDKVEEQMQMLKKALSSTPMGAKITPIFDAMIAGMRS